MLNLLLFLLLYCMFKRHLNCYLDKKNCGLKNVEINDYYYQRFTCSSWLFFFNMSLFFQWTYYYSAIKYKNKQKRILIFKISIGLFDLQSLNGLLVVQELLECMCWFGPIGIGILCIWTVLLSNFIKSLIPIGPNQHICASSFWTVRKPFNNYRSNEPNAVRKLLKLKIFILKVRICM